MVNKEQKDKMKFLLNLKSLTKTDDYSSIKNRENREISKNINEARELIDSQLELLDLISKNNSFLNEMTPEEFYKRHKKSYNYNYGDHIIYFDYYGDTIGENSGYYKALVIKFKFNNDDLMNSSIRRKCTKNIFKLINNFIKDNDVKKIIFLIGHNDNKIDFKIYRWMFQPLKQELKNIGFGTEELHYEYQK
jgi:hypothetical protein